MEYKPEIGDYALLHGQLVQVGSLEGIHNGLCGVYRFNILTLLFVYVDALTPVSIVEKKRVQS